MADVHDSWCAKAFLRFHRHGAAGGTPGATVHQGGATAPLKLQRAFRREDGRCELPILHTAGGLVGGDELTIEAHLEAGSRALLTSVAAQKVYGSIGRSRLAPEGRWAGQALCFRLDPEADLEWLPQEVVLFAGGLFRQRTRVELAAGASFLGAEVVRLGRSGSGDGLGEGRWRSLLEIRRCGKAEGEEAAAGRWELVDRLELAGDSLGSPHGMAAEPVFGSLVWAAPSPLAAPQLEQLLTDCRRDRGGLPGEMACGALRQGLVARYRGPSSQAARFWFSRIWARLRAVRGLPPPRLPRVWPFQEEPFGPPGLVSPSGLPAARSAESG